MTQSLHNVCKCRGMNTDCADSYNSSRLPHHTHITVVRCCRLKRHECVPGSIKSLLRLYQGPVKALLRIYYDSVKAIKALLRQGVRMWWQETVGGGGSRL